MIYLLLIFLLALCGLNLFMLNKISTSLSNFRRDFNIWKETPVEKEKEVKLERTLFEEKPFVRKLEPILHRPLAAHEAINCGR